MKKSDYKATGEITKAESIIARNKAITNLVKAKEIESIKMKSGKKYVRIDNRTLVLK